MFHVPDRKESTLIPIIIQNVAEGTTIMSDKFSSYVNLKTNQSKIEQYGLDHFWTNHSVNFVDKYQPDIHTNSIERQWRRLRNKISNIKRSFSGSIIQNYLNTFMIKSMMTPEEVYIFFTNSLQVQIEYKKIQELSRSSLKMN